MNLHQWDVTVEEAVALQRSLVSQIQTENRCDPATIQTVAGLDASYKEEGNAAVVVLSYPDLTPVEQATAVAQSVFPYVPGLLSFRETPIALRAFEKLTSLPDVIMVDGQGIAHPRRFGIACHLGLLLDRPTIGVAKSRLVGTYEEPGNQPGDRSPLLYKGEIIGAVVRTRLRCNPLFISVGHQIDLETAVSLVLSCQKGYRLPEPTRQAHILAGTRTT